MTDSTLKKFAEKNKDKINEMLQYIEDNKTNIRLIIASSELFYYLTSIEGFNELNDEMLKYGKIRILRDSYHVTNIVSFVMKSNHIRFDVPCICGIFSDERHP